jgi:hypothetical protein
MAKISANPEINLSLTFTVNEAEARALDALVGYGDDAFIKVFKESLGAAYIRDHERGLREFFQSIRSLVPPILSRIDRSRDAFNSTPLKP